MIPKRIILGIVAEYDPFHNGHAFHLSFFRNALHPDSVYSILSPCVKQRIDAAFLLPVMWTLRDAEHYTLGAVSLLCSLGITHLAFGAETDDMNLLMLAADFLEDPPSDFQDSLKAFLDEGVGYPAAMSRVVSAFRPDVGRLLLHPNNILGI